MLRVSFRPLAWSCLTYWCLVGNGWVAGGCWWLLGLLLLVIMDHSRKFPTFSTSKSSKFWRRLEPSVDTGDSMDPTLRPKLPNFVRLGLSWWRSLGSWYFSQNLDQVGTCLPAMHRIQWLCSFVETLGPPSCGSQLDSQWSDAACDAHINSD